MYYPVISQLFTREQFYAKSRCLHLTNERNMCDDKTSPEYDKMHKVRWLVDKICGNCKAQWNLSKEVTVDEMMICYKGKYCPACQYMPKKPKKWEIKI